MRHDALNRTLAATRPKRETAQQRDERIVRERGPWRAYFACVEPLGFTDLACDEEVTRANRAAARVLNRIAKSEGKP